MDHKLAFPKENMYQTEDGLTKREWFAAHAMVGLLSSRPYSLSAYPTNNDALMARNALFLADALIQELDNKEGE